MQINFNGDIVDMSAMLVSAERYALGRRTYIVEWTCNVIERNLHLITQADKQVMIRDIESCKCLRDECDEKEWKILLQILKNNLEDK